MQTGSKYMEPSKEQTAQLVLLGAKRDLEIAWHNFEGAYFEATCFYAFLAAEKSIKSLLFLSGSYPPGRPIKQHDLVLLFREARRQYSELSSIEGEVAVFRIYDEHTRYLDEAEERLHGKAAQRPMPKKPCQLLREYMSRLIKL